MSFTEVSGIAADYDQVTYRHGGGFQEGEMIQTFSFDKVLARYLQAWDPWKGTALSAQLAQGRELRSMEVSLCDERGAAHRVAIAATFSVRAPTRRHRTVDLCG